MKSPDTNETLCKWHVIEVSVRHEQTDAAALILEAFGYALMEAGATGTETTVLTVTDIAKPYLKAGSSKAMKPLGKIIAYFDEDVDDVAVRTYIREALKLYDAPIGISFKIEHHILASRDWLAEWKANWQPVTIGERFIIAPSWKDVSLIGDADKRHVIRIEPGMAFGTGTHETTRLCIEAIEKHFDGTSFLDVGTGTGVLAIAAAMMNPKARIEACDTDAEAVTIARENARVNAVGERIEFRVGSIDEQTASADFVCANLTVDVITPLLPLLLKLTCGRLVLSGILAEQAASIERQLAECGVTNYEIMPDGEWVAFVI